VLCALFGFFLTRIAIPILHAFYNIFLTFMQLFEHTLMATPAMWALKALSPSECGNI
jgi:hypothetical protein